MNLRKLWKENKGLILFISLMMVFRSAVADWNYVPSGSMEPTILPGDYILIDKMAYDIRVPFSTQSIMKLGDPVHGDIIIFESDAAGKRLVKRVIGQPGDTVTMHNKQVSVNGKASEYLLKATTESGMQLIEIGIGDPHSVKWQPLTRSALDHFTVTVPDDHYFVLGDNRDNSADSRFIGFVPRNEIIGRGHHVLLSFDKDSFYKPRPNRIWQPLP